MDAKNKMGKRVTGVLVGLGGAGAVWWLVKNWEIWTEWWMTALEFYGLSVTVVLMLVAIGVGIVSWVGNRRLMGQSMREGKGREVRPFYLCVMHYLRSVEKVGQVRGYPSGHPEDEQREWHPELELKSSIRMSEGALEQWEIGELRRVLGEGSAYHGQDRKKEAVEWAKREQLKMKRMFRRYLEV